MISQERLEKAMHYLATTDEVAADLLAVMERAEFKAKSTKDAVFVHDEGSVADRTARAGISEEYGMAMSEYFDSVKAYNTVKNKRQTETLVIDVWRSMNANRRQAA